MAAIGKKYDTEKTMWHLLPYDALSYVAQVMTFGARKYGPGNWRQLEAPEDRYFSAMMRHLTAWRSGERFDPETGLPHLAHAATNALFLLWFDLKRANLSRKQAFRKG